MIWLMYRWCGIQRPALDATGAGPPPLSAGEPIGLLLSLTKAS